MSDLARMEKALANAAAAGDVEGARTLARDMRRMLQAGNPEITAPDSPLVTTAKDTPAGEAAMVSAGRAVDKIATGAAQLVNKAAGDQMALDAIDKSEAEKNAAMGALKKERPVATAGGEALPYVGIPVSAGLAGGSAIVAGAEALKPGTGEERLARGATGGVANFAGGLLARPVANFFSPVSRSAASPGHQAALESAERIGMQPTLGEATGNSFVRKLEDYVSRAPGGSSVMADHASRNQAAVNRAAAASIGESADQLTPEVFKAAADRIGKVFETIKTLPGRPIQLGQDVTTAADEILRQQGKMLPNQRDPDLIALANQAKTLAANKGRIDGETYQLTRSGLSQGAFDATGTTKTHYGRLLEALDDSADASLRATGNTALADALQTARPQYANLKLLERGSTAEAGNVSPAKVASTMRTNNPSGFRRGDFWGPLPDVARVGEGLKPLRPGSPTFEREAFSNPASVALNWLWSAPIAHTVTSRAATLYPRTLGNTAAARTAAGVIEPSGRAAVAAALQNSGLIPVMAE